MIETVRAERIKQRKRTVAALLASLLIHALIVLAAFVILSLKPKWIQSVAPKPPEPEPAELTLLPPPEPPKKNERDFFDSSQGTVSKEVPKHAAFESDQNTAAASERPGQSDKPVPTQDGDNAPGLTLESRNLSLGPSREPSPPSPKSPAQPQQRAKEAPREKKQPVEKPAEKEARTTPTARPRPKTDESELALLEPSRPRPSQPEDEVRKPEQPSPPSAPRPPGFQPQTRVTRLTGGISNRGRASLDAVATPLGRYKKMISDAIGSRWYYYVNDMLDLVGIGTVELRFVVRADGKVERVQVLRNTSNESLASCSVRSIIEAEIPPIPKEIAPTLEGGRLEVDYSFTIIGQ
ncbi:MAG: hypothetical protein PHC88_14350 [Terrimicrobiaceae bacterium]|nr:hypothetical protein [Terrimicrobiaceae bacterium]